MANICIIPARGGSKRIPKKNIKCFLGKPIIAYSIETAISSGLFDEVMVSTDSEEIATIAASYGAKIPFLRSNENANDVVGIADVLIEVLNKYDKKFDICCCILPTAPLLRDVNIIKAFSLLNSSCLDCVFPVLQYSFPIQRSLKIVNNKAILNWPENYYKRSQDLEPTYHDAGQFYLIRSKHLIQEKKLFTSNSGVIILNELEAQDIDTESDWLIAEIKYNTLHYS